MVTLLCRNRLCSEIPEPGRLRLLRKFSITHLRHRTQRYLLLLQTAGAGVQRLAWSIYSCS